MRTRFRLQNFFEAFGLLGLGLIFLYLSLSGEYQNYLTARSLLPLLLAIPVLLLLGVSALWDLERPCYRLNSRVLALLLPLLLLLLPPLAFSSRHYSGGLAAIELNQALIAQGQAVDEQPDEPQSQSQIPVATRQSNSATPNTSQLDASLNQAQATGSDPGSANAQLALDAALNTNPALDPYGSTSQQAANSTDPTLDQATPVGEIPADRRIRVSNADFFDWFVEILTHLDRYDGCELDMTGFVFAPTQRLGTGGPVNLAPQDSVPDLAAADPIQSQFLLARKAMICCAADMTPLGLFAENRSGSSLTVDSWYRFHGQLERRVLAGREQLVLLLQSVSPSTAPTPAYVIPIIPQSKDGTPGAKAPVRLPAPAPEHSKVLPTN